MSPTQGDNTKEGSEVGWLKAVDEFNTQAGTGKRYVSVFWKKTGKSFRIF